MRDNSIDTMRRPVAGVGGTRVGGTRIGGTIGAFDLLHVGHLRFLQQARAACDYLKVAVGADNLLAHSKKLQVSVPDQQRMELLAGLACVDDVTLFDIGMDNSEATAEWVRAWGVDVLFVSEDWRSSARMRALEPMLLARGIVCEWFPYTAGISSTMIRQRVASLYKGRDCNAERSRIKSEV